MPFSYFYTHISIQLLLIFECLVFVVINVIGMSVECVFAKPFSKPSAKPFRKLFEGEHSRRW